MTEKTIYIDLIDLDAYNNLAGINRDYTVTIKNLDNFKIIFTKEIEINNSDEKIHNPIVSPYKGNEKNFCDALIYLHQDTKEYEDVIKLFQERYNKIREKIPADRSNYLHWVNLFKEKVNSELNERAEKYELVEPKSDYIDIFSEDPKVIAEKLKTIKYIEKYIEIGRQIERNENQLKTEQSTIIEKPKVNQQTKGCNIF